MCRLSITGAVLAAAIAATPAVPAGAFYTHDKLTFMTFSGSVQVPGTILNAGTYRFRLTNNETSRNVLQVLSRDGSQVHAMFLTIPDSRARLTGEATVTFRETPVGVPPAVKSLFYGNEYGGYEFVYPKGWPMMKAEVVPQPEITYTPAPAAIAEPIATPAPEPVFEPVPELYEEAARVQELPRTATQLPLLALGGLATLLAGLGIGFLRR